MRPYKQVKKLFILLFSQVALTVFADENFDNGSILFSEQQKGEWNIVSMNIDNIYSRSQLTNNKARDLQGRFHAKTQSLFFDSYRDKNHRNLFKKELKTGEITQLTQSVSRDGHPDISADGKMLAFQSSRSGDSEVYLLEIDTQKITQLTSSKGFDGIPVWSENDSKIAFNSSRTGSPNVFTWDVSNQKLTQLTDLSSAQFVQDWHPLEDKLLVRSNLNGKYQLFWLDTSNRTLTLIDLPLESDILSAQVDTRGVRIVFLSMVGEYQQVFVYDLESKRISQLTYNKSEKRFPAFME